MCPGSIPPIVDECRGEDPDAINSHEGRGFQGQEAACAEAGHKDIVVAISRKGKLCLDMFQPVMVIGPQKVSEPRAVAWERRRVDIPLVACQPPAQVAHLGRCAGHTVDQVHQHLRVTVKGQIGAPAADHAIERAWRFGRVLSYVWCFVHWANK